MIVINTWISEISTSDSNKHMDIRDIDPVIAINTWISTVFSLAAVASCFEPRRKMTLSMLSNHEARRTMTFSMLSNHEARRTITLSMLSNHEDEEQ